MEKEGDLITSIPYDRHFEVRVDGKQVTCEKVNTAFLGVKLEKGEHEITIIYHAPGAAVGKIMSLFGFFLFLGIGLEFPQFYPQTSDYYCIFINNFQKMPKI